MISIFRMKFDTIGQLILIIGAILLGGYETGLAWTNTFLVILALWQIASAIHLLMAYQFIRRINFLRTMLVLILSLPLWIHLVGYYAYLPVGGVLIWYFIQTIKDMRWVIRRPRSFWDL